MTGQCTGGGEGEGAPMAYDRSVHWGEGEGRGRGPPMAYDRSVHWGGAAGVAPLAFPSLYAGPLCSWT